MNRKLGHLIKAAIFALPLALPGVALAQTAGGSTSSSSTTTTTTDTSNPAAQDNGDKGSLGQDKNLGNDNAQGSSGMNSGTSSGSFDRTDQQNAGQLGNSTGSPGQGSSATGVDTGAQGTAGTNDIDRTPPAGKLDSSGSSTSSDRNIGGDINKSNDSSDLSSDTSSARHKKTTTKKTVKRSSSSSDLNNDTSNDLNR